MKITAADLKAISVMLRACDLIWDVRKQYKGGRTITEIARAVGIDEKEVAEIINTRCDEVSQRIS